MIFSDEGEQREFGANRQSLGNWKVTFQVNIRDEREAI